MRQKWRRMIPRCVMQSFDNSHGWVVLGIYIKYYEKVLENFKWASDMVWFTFFFFKHYLAPVWKADKERGAAGVSSDLASCVHRHERGWGCLLPSVTCAPGHLQLGSRQCWTCGHSLCFTGQSQRDGTFLPLGVTVSGGVSWTSSMCPVSWSCIMRGADLKEAATGDGRAATCEDPRSIDRSLEK